MSEQKQHTLSAAFKNAAWNAGFTVYCLGLTAASMAIAADNLFLVSMSGLLSAAFGYGTVREFNKGLKEPKTPPQPPAGVPPTQKP